MRYDVLEYTRIRDIRTDQSLKQKEVASMLKIAPNTLSQYENGERGIPVDILANLALIYNTSTDYLLGITDTKSPYKRTNKFVARYCYGKNQP